MTQPKQTPFLHRDIISISSNFIQPQEVGTGVSPFYSLEAEASKVKEFASSLKSWR